MVCDPSSGGRRYDQAAVPSEPLRSRLESLTRRFRSDAPDDSASPFAVTSRNLATETRPEGGGTEGFETADAMRINAARLANLGSLGLPLEGRSVLDVGSGPGHLAQFFVDRGCRIVSTDARAENIERMHELYPAHDGHVADVEHDDCRASAVSTSSSATACSTTWRTRSRRSGTWRRPATTCC
jgi:2-polyprenyl-3-methyl-5-hydroxy-6-metoxy-1,4-benzoquinol methylase